MLAPAPEPLDYAPSEPPRLPRAARRVIALLLCAVALFVAAPFAANAYAASRYGGVKPGMTRAEVDRHLWAFASRVNTTYQSGLRARGQVMVNYELLGLGKSATITVTFEADGLASGAIPMFDN